MGGLFKTFPDDQAAKGWFESNIWPDGRVCPRCGCGYTCVAKHPEMPYRCSGCKKYFGVKLGTIMEHSKIIYRNWAVATYLLATRPQGMSGVQPGRDLGTKQGSAWLLPHRPRESWRTLAGPDPVAGPVEVDEVYLGGREKNKHADRKGRRKKTAVVGIKDRETGIIRSVSVPEAASRNL